MAPRWCSKVPDATALAAGSIQRIRFEVPFVLVMFYAYAHTLNRNRLKMPEHYVELSRWTYSTQVAMEGNDAAKN